MIRRPSAVSGPHLGLFCVGLWAGSLGPLLPFLADDLGLSLDTAGLLLTALFAGSISASTVVAARLHRRDTREVAVAGLALAIVGVTGLGLAGRPAIAFVAAAGLGVGDGLLVAAAHQQVAQASVNVGRAIARLNVWFAAGAVAGPLWAGAILEAGTGRDVVYGGIGLCAVVAAIAMAAGPGSSRRPVEAGSDGERWRSRRLFTMGAVLFLYVGAEIGLGAWVSSYAERAAGAGVFEGAAVTAGYWAALAAGRLLTTSALGRAARPERLLMLAIAGSTASAVLLVAFGESLAPGAAAALGAGLFFGPIWPVAMTIAVRDGHPGVSATLVTVGNAGGLVFPWLQGKLLVQGTPAQGVMVTVALCVAMLLVAFVSLFARTSPRERPTSRSTARW